MQSKKRNGDKMKILITGASSGIGASFARKFDAMGHDLILVSRSKKNLDILKKELKGNVKIISMDLSSTFNCMKLYNKVKKDHIDILINNAGFGLCGRFEDLSLEKELDMIDLNIKTVHTLTKLFYQDFKERDSGFLLNVASSAAFLPGPLMTTYYATKSYVLRLTEALYEELRVDKSKVYVGCLCPGPVDTNFNTVAGVEFSMKPLTSDYVAEYAIKKMFKGKLVIIPGFGMKVTSALQKTIPTKIAMRFAYKIQKSKIK